MGRQIWPQTSQARDQGWELGQRLGGERRGAGDYRAQRICGRKVGTSRGESQKSERSKSPNAWGPHLCLSCQEVG